LDLLQSGDDWQFDLRQTILASDKNIWNVKTLLKVLRTALRTLLLYLSKTR